MEVAAGLAAAADVVPDLAVPFIEGASGVDEAGVPALEAVGDVAFAAVVVVVAALVCVADAGAVVLFVAVLGAVGGVLAVLVVLPVGLGIAMSGNRSSNEANGSAIGLARSDVVLLLLATAIFVVLALLVSAATGVEGADEDVLFKASSDFEATMGALAGVVGLILATDVDLADSPTAAFSASNFFNASSAAAF